MASASPMASAAVLLAGCTEVHGQASVRAAVPHYYEADRQATPGWPDGAPPPPTGPHPACAEQLGEIGPQTLLGRPPRAVGAPGPPGKIPVPPARHPLPTQR